MSIINDLLKSLLEHSLNDKLKLLEENEVIYDNYLQEFNKSNYDISSK